MTSNSSSSSTYGTSDLRAKKPRAISPCWSRKAWYGPQTRANKYVAKRCVVSNVWRTRPSSSVSLDASALFAITSHAAGAVTVRS